VKVTDIGVLVKNGTVTLNGHVSTFGEKWDAVSATKRVAGVNAIADDIEVSLRDSPPRSDADIAAAVANRIDWSPTITAGSIHVTVSEGWVTLEGAVEWWYQKNEVEKAVQHLSGVKGVSSQITIKPSLVPSDVEKAIMSAFKRNAILNADNIKVETTGNNVTLRGKVRNHAEQEEAGRAAWAAPGVASVDNQLSVKWAWFAD
jgi:osmotically-inducible protein OsmY